MYIGKYKYPFRYCNSRKLCEEHGIPGRTLERWISEEKGKIPGRILISGVRNYIYDPVIFHDQFLVSKLNGPTRNEYEKREHLLIINNLQERRSL